jgi:hypothetical protein
MIVGREISRPMGARAMVGPLGAPETAMRMTVRFR